MVVDGIRSRPGVTLSRRVTDLRPRRNIFCGLSKSFVKDQTRSRRTQQEENRSSGPRVGHWTTSVAGLSAPTADRVVKSITLISYCASIHLNRRPLRRKASLFPARRALAPPTCPLRVGNEAYRQSSSNLRPTPNQLRLL